MNELDEWIFCRTDSESWKAALLEEIDADQLPVYYGGTMTELQDNAMFSIQVFIFRITASSGVD